MKRRRGKPAPSDEDETPKTPRSAQEGQGEARSQSRPRRRKKSRKTLNYDAEIYFMTDNLRIGIPSKGRLAEMASQLLIEAGLKFRRQDRSLFARVRDMPIEITFYGPTISLCCAPKGDRHGHHWRRPD